MSIPASGLWGVLSPVQWLLEGKKMVSSMTVVILQILVFILNLLGTIYVLESSSSCSMHSVQVL